MKKYVLLLIGLLLASSLSFSQTISKTTSSTVSGTVCPVSATWYEVSVPSELTSCQINWSATNGQVTVDQNNQRKAKVEWTDTPGASGTVTATFVGCSNENNNGTTASKTELILSIKNQSWGSYTSSYNLDYCTTPYVDIFMPPMNVQGTGGIAQPPRVEASYIWTIPAGWRYQATGQTGTFGTPQSNIRIEPIGCARPGNVTVKGTLVGAGPFCNSAAQSATATISLNGANPVVTIGPQAGYTGGSACNTAPVTFYATTSVALGCISGYSWEYPQSWDFVSQTGNSITLEPSGTQADANAIKATVNFSCGSSVTSGNYVPPFNAPVISLGSATAVCSGGTTVTLTNAGPNAQVNWTVPSSMIVDSGQGTPIANIKAANATIRELGTINAILTSCPSVSVDPKSIWVGKPYDFLVQGPTLVQAGSFNFYEMKKWGWPTNPSYPTFTEQGVTSNGFTWSFGWPATSAGWNCGNCVGEHNTIQAGNQSTYVTAHIQNTCGITTRNYEVFVQQVDCPPGGCEEPFFVYPNPSSEELTVSTNLSSGKSIAEVTLVDSHGAIVYSSKLRGKEQIKIPVQELKNGLYYLSVSQGGTIRQRQIIIRH